MNSCATAWRFFYRSKCGLSIHNQQLYGITTTYLQDVTPSLFSSALRELCILNYSVCPT